MSKVVQLAPRAGTPVAIAQQVLRMAQEGKLRSLIFYASDAADPGQWFQGVSAEMDLTDLLMCRHAIETYIDRYEAASVERTKV